MKTDILIPSCREIGELKVMINAVKETYDTSKSYRYITSGFKVSAASNRNYCLQQSDAEIIIMMDDDIGGFYPGWQEMLIQPLLDDDNIKIVSARLMTDYGDLSAMMGCDANIKDPISIANNIILSACIAFRKKDIDGIWFDENYIGSGFEDTDFCFQMTSRHPGCKFVVNNKCQLIHFHEMKNQVEYLPINQKYFNAKWKKALKGEVFHA